MWHIALREVDNLEEALKSYQDNRHVDVAQKKFDDVRLDISDGFCSLHFQYIELNVLIF